ncbi:MAG: GNAT family N-acetyltransferase [Candidatus Heimdallarchaeaceae archaeon]
MTEEDGLFLKIAQENLAKFCFMVWDYFTFPDYFKVEHINSSLLCIYDSHNLLFGEPKQELIDKIESNKEIVISFDSKWLKLILENFKNFKLIDNSGEKGIFNTFFCMRLQKNEFKAKGDHFSEKLTEKEEKLLPIQRRIHLSRGMGGVGIIHNNRIVACAFAPHVTKNENFSYAIVRDVWTYPEERKKGYGYDVSSKICEEVFKQEIKDIYLYVEKNNFPAVRIYEKLGFKVEDEVLSTVCEKKKKS